MKFFTTVHLPIGRYANEQPMTGFLEKDQIYQTSTPYHPYHVDHDSILRRLLEIKKKGFFVEQNWVKMPYDRTGKLDMNSYQIVDAPQKLETTLVSSWFVHKEAIASSLSEFVISRDGMKPLSDYVSLRSDYELFTNGGYFVTPNLLYANDFSKPWSFENRYPEFTLPKDISPFYGWYYHKRDTDIYTTLANTHKTGKIRIDSRGLPSLVTEEVPFHVKSILIGGWGLDNPEVIRNDHSSESIAQAQTIIEKSGWHETDWHSYREIIDNGRVNVFIANRGVGIHPQDEVLAIWHDRYPVINFGYIVSISQEEFLQTDISIGDSVRVIGDLPQEYIDTDMMYDLSAVLVQDGKGILDASSAESIMQSFSEQGFTHPSFQLSQESIPLSPYKRVPSHVFIETENYFGGMIFNGRYELSVGACILDEVHILNLFGSKRITPEPILHAVKADGGSGAKIAMNDGGVVQFGNLPAPGSRNAFGDGNSNFYHGVAFRLK